MLVKASIISDLSLAPAGSGMLVNYSRPKLSALACEYYFARHKDEQHYSRLHHPVDEPWEQLWFIAR